MDTPSNKIFIKMKKKAPYNLAIALLTDDKVALMLAGMKAKSRQLHNRRNAH